MSDVKRSRSLDRAEFERRMKQFALRVMRLADRLPRTRTGELIGKQLLRSAMSVGANYRAAGRARSRAEFLAKLGIVEEEADECVYWIEMLIEGKILRAELLKNLLKEANEIVAMVVASIKTSKGKK